MSYSYSRYNAAFPAPNVFEAPQLRRVNQAHVGSADQVNQVNNKGNLAHLMRPQHDEDITLNVLRSDTNSTPDFGNTANLLSIGSDDGLNDGYAHQTSATNSQSLDAADIALFQALSSPSGRIESQHSTSDDPSGKSYTQFQHGIPAGAIQYMNNAASVTSPYIGQHTILPQFGSILQTVPSSALADRFSVREGVLVHTHQYPESLTNTSQPYFNPAMTTLPDLLPQNYVSYPGIDLNQEVVDLWNLLVEAYEHQFTIPQMKHDFHLLWWHKWDLPRNMPYVFEWKEGFSEHARFVVPGTFPVVKNSNNGKSKPKAARGAKKRSRAETSDKDGRSVEKPVSKRAKLTSNTQQSHTSTTFPEYFQAANTSAYQPIHDSAIQYNASTYAPTLASHQVMSAANDRSVPTMPSATQILPDLQHAHPATYEAFFDGLNTVHNGHHDTLPLSYSNNVHDGSAAMPSYPSYQAPAPMMHLPYIYDTPRYTDQYIHQDGVYGTTSHSQSSTLYPPQHLPSPKSTLSRATKPRQTPPSPAIPALQRFPEIWLPPPAPPAPLGPLLEELTLAPPIYNPNNTPAQQQEAEEFFARPLSVIMKDVFAIKAAREQWDKEEPLRLKQREAEKRKKEAEQQEKEREKEEERILFSELFGEEDDENCEI